MELGKDRVQRKNRQSIVYLLFPSRTLGDGELALMVILALFFGCQFIPCNTCLKFFCLIDPLEKLMKTTGSSQGKEITHG